MDVLAALAMGLLLGAITGMPLGVVNVAIVDAAVAGERRHALGIGIGGAIADTIHTLLAFVGLGRVVTARPQYARWLAIVAAIAIIAFAIASWRRRRTPHAPRDIATAGTLRGILSGIVLTLPNPAALAAWVAVAAMTWPDASISLAIVVAAGVGVGSAAWFIALGRLIAKVPENHRALQIIPHVALVMFVGIAIAGVVRAI